MTAPPAFPPAPHVADTPADDSAHLDRLILVVWTLSAGAMLLSSIAGPFAIAWNTFALPGMAALALIAGAEYYTRLRPDPRIAAALRGTGQIIGFSLIAAPLSYIAASSAQPLQDGWFDQIDRAVGLDWKIWLDWMNANPRLHLLFYYAYMSFTAQAALAVVVLAFSGRIERLRRFVLAFMLTVLAVIVTSALIATQGVWGHFGYTPADYPAITPGTDGEHLQTLFALRDGTLRVLSGVGSLGIISFPSLHAGLGLVYWIALWPVRGVRWFAAAINVLLIAATPVDGGHYFSEVVIGLAMAAAVWIAVQWPFRRVVLAPVAAAAPVPAEMR